MFAQFIDIHYFIVVDVNIMNINELCKHFLKLIYNFFPLNSLGRTADNH